MIHRNLAVTLGFTGAYLGGAFALKAAEHAGFIKEGFATSQRRAPFFHDSFDVIGMNECCPLPALQIL